MDKYLITHSLLSSWLYAIKGNPYEDATTERDSYQDFLRVLRREPTETTEAMQNGKDFEDLVTAITFGTGDPLNRWYDAAYKIAQIVKGGPLQLTARRIVNVSDMTFVLYGRLDALKAGTIYDVKFSKSYDVGKYIDSTQHPTYFELIPEAKDFTYLVSNGATVWKETYRRDEAPSILPVISDFADWLTATGLMATYREKWAA